MHDDCHPGRQDLLRGGVGEGREEYLRSPRHFKKPITVNTLVGGHPREKVSVSRAVRSRELFS